MFITINTGNMLSYKKYTLPPAPTPQEVQTYFEAKGRTSQTATDFFNYYQKRKWKAKKGRPLRNWKAAAFQWMAAPNRKEVKSLLPTAA